MHAVIKRTTKEDQRIASRSIRSFRKIIPEKGSTSSRGVRIRVKESGEFITIPRKALSLLEAILSNMAEGKSITIVPSDSELSTQQAADMLNVSRPHLVKLLESGAIPFKKVGSHRRIQLQDLIDYEKSLNKLRRSNLDKLAEQAQRLNFGY